jgi:glutathione S-transferase
MITLHGFGPNFGLPDPSPFVLKVDCFMRMAELAFEVNTNTSNLQNAPKGKLPFIKDKGHVIADSFFILEYLKKEKNTKLDDWLSEDQHALAYCISKSLEENFYWCIVYSRWMKEDTWQRVKHAFFAGLPLPLRVVVPSLVRRGVKNTLKNQGIGKHNDKEILQIADCTLQSLSSLIADKKFILGNKPCSLDATVYAFLAAVILVDIDDSLTQLARKYGNLLEYCQRMQQQYYSDELNL